MSSEKNQIFTNFRIFNELPILRKRLDSLRHALSLDVCRNYAQFIGNFRARCAFGS